VQQYAEGSCPPAVVALRGVGLQPWKMTVLGAQGEGSCEAVKAYKQCQNIPSLSECAFPLSLCALLAMRIVLF
jgi:hypothetical protein